MGALEEIEKRAVGFLEESDGSKSASRLCMVAVIGFTLGILLGLFFKIRGPISMAEFSVAIEKLGLFAGGTCSALYGINRFGDFATRPKGPDKE
jgi:hypothetical protein